MKNKARPQLSRKPFIIGIAGDSASGKNTLSNALEGLLGKHSVTRISGDNYHLWDRHHSMWQSMTHLNPEANKLENFTNDILQLCKGEPIFTHYYDHETGKISPERHVGSNDFIIASGLHALFVPELRKCYNLKIYLDTDEELRRYLKIRRDVNERGHSIESVNASLEMREPDANQFIRPQSAYADLIIKLQSIVPLPIEDISKSGQLKLRLIVKSRYGFNKALLSHALVGVNGLHIDISTSNEGDESVMVMEGDIPSEAMAAIAPTVAPDILDFLGTDPCWKSGTLGLMQLITLLHMDQILNRSSL